MKFAHIGALWLLRVTVAASFLVCVLAIAQWARSYWWVDKIAHGYSYQYHGIHSANGVVSYYGTRHHYTTSALAATTPYWWRNSHPARPEADPLAGIKGCGFEMFGIGYASFTAPEDMVIGPGGLMARVGVIDVLEFSFPYWLIAVVSGLAPAVQIVRFAWRRRRSKLGLCPACGYDLRATPDRCPECGRETGPARSQAFSYQRSTKTTKDSSTSAQYVKDL